MTPRISHDGLHQILWQRAGRTRTVRIVQNRFCNELLVTRHTLCRVLKAMEDEGRLVCLTTTGGASSKTYEVIEPAVWRSRRG